MNRFAIILARTLPGTWNDANGHRAVTALDMHSSFFTGHEWEINEKVYEAAGVDWKQMDNRSSTAIGLDIWVVSGYDRVTKDAYVFIVQGLGAMPTTGEGGFGAVVGAEANIVSWGEIPSLDEAPSADDKV